MFIKSLPVNSIYAFIISQMHYYQPMWTLVGGGLKKMEQSQKPMSQVLPKVLRTSID